MPYRIFRLNKIEISIPLEFREAIELLPADKIIPALVFDKNTIEALDLFYQEEKNDLNRSDILLKMQTIAQALNAEAPTQVAILTAIENDNIT